MSSFGVIWIYHITIHNTQKVSTSYSFFFPQRINKNYQVYPLVVEHGQAATSGWCADSKRGRYRLFTRIVDVGMGQKGGDLASNGGKHHYTKMQLWKKQHVVNTWPNIKFQGMFLFSDEDIYIIIWVSAILETSEELTSSWGICCIWFVLLRCLVGIHILCLTVLEGYHHQKP